MNVNVNVNVSEFADDFPTVTFRLNLRAVNVFLLLKEQICDLFFIYFEHLNNIENSYLEKVNM